ncbi:MAG: hypothetical protein EXQ84_03075 [Rhodospirillaceae bacterium]|nr:hypothetical protein [Rhodospirillaceae bacterium]
MPLLNRDIGAQILEQALAHIRGNAEAASVILANNDAGYNGDQRANDRQKRERQRDRASPRLIFSFYFAQSTGSGATQSIPGSIRKHSDSRPARAGWWRPAFAGA